MDNGIQKIVDEANAKLAEYLKDYKYNVDFEFDWDWLDNENLVFNCNGEFTDKVKETDLYGFMNRLHSEYGHKIERYLNESYGPPSGYDEVNEDDFWVMHETEGFFWDADGEETDGDEDFATMQYQFYWSIA